MSTVTEQKAKAPLQFPSRFNRQDGREMERNFFNSFLYFEPELQSGDVAHCECPDFLISLGDKVVGVEVTQLFRPTGRQDVENTQDQILRTAWQKAQEQNLPPADVCLFFNLHRSYRRDAHERIADAVVRVVADHMPVDGESARIERVSGQPSSVDLILVSRRHCGALGNWTWLDVGPVERDVVSVVQEAITRKAKKLPVYLQRCDDCRLLLVADSFRTSGRLAFDHNCHSCAFISPFTHTYALDFGRGHLHRLQTSGTGSCVTSA